MKQPNIILFTGEDTGRHQGCYGDRYGRTPWIDRLAREGCLYTNAISTAPVCSPSRATIVTGRFPTEIGVHNHRSQLATTPWLFTQGLREAGYFVNWGNKTDFNFEPPAEFADARSDWTTRLDELSSHEQPFFLYYNFNDTHESKLWPPGAKALPNPFVDEPGMPAADLEGVPVPPTLPDTPTTRAGLRRYYTGLEAQDAKLGAIMAALEAQGLRESTLIIYTSDHGRGEPRGKRWLYEAGIHLPLVVSGPGIDAGTSCEELVSWVDFAPTLLRLAGATAPTPLSGRVFLGPDKEAEPAQVFAGRDRMDEAYDRCRAARECRLLYIHNDFPQLPWGARQWYEETSPILAEMRQLDAAGALRFPENVYLQDAKPPEELFDTVADPHCLYNLAANPAYAADLQRLREALATWRARYDVYGQQDERELIAQGVTVDAPKHVDCGIGTLPEPLRRGGRFDSVRFPPLA